MPDAMGKMGNFDLAVRAQPLQFRRSGRTIGQIQQRRSGDLGVDQRLAIGHRTGEAVPSVVNVRVYGWSGCWGWSRLGLSPDPLAGRLEQQEGKELNHPHELSSTVEWYMAQARRVASGLEERRWGSAARA